MGGYSCYLSKVLGWLSTNVRQTVKSSKLFKSKGYFLKQVESRELQAWENDLREREAMLHDRRHISFTQYEDITDALEEELHRRCSVLDQVFLSYLRAK